MSKDIGPGDVVVCVDARPPFVSPRVLGAVENTGTAILVRGRHYLVNRSVSVLTEAGVVLEGVPHRWFAFRFRKLNDGEDDAELIARIKNCSPVREGVPA